MSKKNLFISAALTTFVLVILASVIAVYAKQSSSTGSQQASQPTEVTTATPVTEQPAQFSYVEAANVAASFLGQTDMYSVESAPYNGQDAFKVVFSSGYVVYVGMDGQILASEAPKPVVVTQEPQNKRIVGTNNNQAPAARHEQDEHEHEEGHD